MARIVFSGNSTRSQTQCNFCSSFTCTNDNVHKIVISKKSGFFFSDKKKMVKSLLAACGEIIGSA